MTTKTRHYDNLHTFISKLLKCNDTKMRISTEAKDLLNQLIRDTSIKYITGSIALCKHANKVTIDSNAIETITSIWIKDSNSILDFAHDRWEQYSQYTAKGIAKADRAGLSLPPARFNALFKEYKRVNQKIGEPAYIFLTAIIEYIFSEIIKKAIKLAKQDCKKTVSGIHIFNSIKSESLDHLHPLFKGIFIAGFGWTVRVY